jgi:hypothetical protein
VCINEFLTKRAAGGVDDWVEFYNRGSMEVDLTGWALTDNVDLPTRCLFPPGTSIAQGAYISIDESYCGFSFASDGREIIMLTSGDGAVGQDFFDYGPQTPDVSQGRFPNGTANWHFFDFPTRGFGNWCGNPPPLGATVNLRFTSGTTFTWDAAPDAEAYDTITGDLGLLTASGDYSVAVTGCHENNGADTMSWDPSEPAVGQGTFYLVRGVDFACGFGTYDTTSPFQFAPRDAGIDASQSTCY